MSNNIRSDLDLLLEFEIEPTIDTMIKLIAKHNDYNYVKTQDIAYNMFDLHPENVEYYLPAQRQHMIDKLKSISRIDYMIYAIKRSYSDTEIKKLLKKSIDNLLKDGSLS